MQRHNQIAGVICHQLTDRIPHIQPDTPRHQARPPPSVAQTISKRPHLRQPDHIWVPAWELFKWPRRIELKEINHFRFNGIAILKLQRFNYGFRRAAMPAARIREQKKNFGMLRGIIFHLLPTIIEDF